MENIHYVMLSRMSFIYVLLNFSETQMWKGKLLTGDGLELLRRAALRSAEL